ncbi:MAG: ABC transporter ATP-binding protein [Clostridiales bacterium]|nr:ABC transporter ATP-binding protein [Clostridiales bacterium]
MSEVLVCKNLCKSYGKFPALTDINLNIQRGRIIGLLGPNGSGKTTLIKLISGLLVPSRGELSVNGLPIGVETKKVVSYLPERNYIPDWMKVSDIVELFVDFYTDFNKTRALEMLENLSISTNAKVKNLSKGNKEKVQLILVMSREADLYLLDEPIAGVDPAARDYILKTIISNYNENAAVIISTHLITDIEPVLDEVIMIQNGTLRIHSTVDEIREQNGMSVDALFREVFKC